MAKRRKPRPSRPITPHDLERGFAGVQQGFRQQIEDRRSAVLTIAGGIGFVVVAVIFLLGRRSGRRKTTFVEIRRV